MSTTTVQGLASQEEITEFVDAFRDEGGLLNIVLHRVKKLGRRRVSYRVARTQAPSLFDCEHTDHIVQEIESDTLEALAEVAQRIIRLRPDWREDPYIWAYTTRAVQTQASRAGQTNAERRRWKAWKLHKSGMPIDDIARELKVTPRTIRKYLDEPIEILYADPGKLGANKYIQPGIYRQYTTGAYRRGTAGNRKRVDRREPPPDELIDIMLTITDDRETYYIECKTMNEETCLTPREEKKIQDSLQEKREQYNEELDRVARQELERSRELDHRVREIISTGSCQDLQDALMIDIRKIIESDHEKWNCLAWLQDKWERGVLPHKRNPKGWCLQGLRNHLKEIRANG